MDNAEIFKALGEATRLRIMRLLIKTGKESCGCELVDSLLIPQYNLTKHIDILMQVGFIRSRKEGRWVYYSVCKSGSALCASLCDIVEKTNDKVYENDLMRFKKRLAIREGSKCLLGIQNKKFLS